MEPDSESRKGGTDLTWPSDRMARILDLTPRRMNQLVSEGILFREEKGRYSPVKNVVAYIRYLRDRRDPAGLSNEDDDKATRRALNVARHDEIRLNMEVTARTRIPLDLIEEIDERLHSNIAGILKSRRNKTLDEEALSDIFGELRQVGPTLRAWHQQVTAAEAILELPKSTPTQPAEEGGGDESE